MASFAILLPAVARLERATFCRGEVLIAGGWSSITALISLGAVVPAAGEVAVPFAAASSRPVAAPAGPTGVTAIAPAAELPAAGRTPGVAGTR